MIDKIKSALKTEYKGLGLGDKTIDRLASYVKGFVENEEDIATAIKRDDVKLIATSIQGEIDGLRKAKQSAESALEEYKKAHPEGGGKGEPDEPKGDNEPPKWFKEYLDAQKKERESADFIGAVRKRLENDCKDAPILKQVLKGYVPKEGESEDDAVARLTGEYNETFKEIRGEGYVPPFGGGGESYDSKSDVERRKHLLETKGLIPKSNNN